MTEKQNDGMEGWLKSLGFEADIENRWASPTKLMFGTELIQARTLERLWQDRQKAIEIARLEGEIAGLQLARAWEGPNDWIEYRTDYGHFVLCPECAKMLEEFMKPKVNGELLKGER
jgi:hypothetical protein